MQIDVSALTAERAGLLARVDEINRALVTAQAARVEIESKLV